MKHADEVPILLHMRDQYLQSTATYANDLRALDKRLAANLQGLWLAGEGGWDAAVALFEDRAEPATMMALAYLAYRDKGQSRLAYVQNVLCRDDNLVEMAAFGLGWLGPNDVGTIVQNLWASGDNIDAAIALACALIYEIPPDIREVEMCLKRPKVVRTRAIIVAGWYNMHTLLGPLEASQVDDDPPSITARDVALILLNGDQAAIARILERCEDGFDADFKLLELALCAVDSDAGFDWWRQQDDPDLRIRASGILADKRCVPWLLDQSEDEALAEDALDRVHEITGRKVGDIIAAPDLAKAPDPFAEDGQNDQSPIQRLQTWWAGEQAHFVAGPLVLGQPIEKAILRRERHEMTLAVQRRLSLRDRLRLKTTTFAIGQAPYLGGFRH